MSPESFSACLLTRVSSHDSDMSIHYAHPLEDGRHEDEEDEEEHELPEATSVVTQWCRAISRDKFPLLNLFQISN